MVSGITTIIYRPASGAEAALRTRVDLDGLSWKEPADRQRVQSSEGVPLLLPLAGDTIRRWDVGEWRRGSQVIGVRVGPDG